MLDPIREVLSKLKICLEQMKQLMFFFYPRPSEYENIPGYQDTFMNIWSNNPSVNRLPFSQLYLIAYTVRIDSDHDYFQEKQEIWLKNVNISEISNAEITKFEKKTCGPKQYSFMAV